MAVDEKGLIREYILIIILYCFDIGTEIACYAEVQRSRGRYQSWLEKDYPYSNRTTNFGICTKGGWNKEDFTEKVELYASLIDAYLFFLIISGLVFMCYILAYLWFVLRAWHHRSSSYVEKNRDHIVQVKFTFGFIMSFVLDIPGSCLAVVLYSMRHGVEGLHCWDCAQDVKNCVKKQVMEDRQQLSQSVVGIMFFGLLIVSLWKGITTFYRWSKTDKVDCWQLRGCVALFVGSYYAVIILTPSLGVFKYEFFLLPSQKENVFANFTDSLFMIGMLGWLIFLVIGCCFPLLKCIRIGSPGNILSNKKTSTNVRPVEKVY